MKDHEGAVVESGDEKNDSAVVPSTAASGEKMTKHKGDSHDSIVLVGGHDVERTRFQIHTDLILASRFRS
ncbi:unnamed protein product [Arabidopsis arenosa]|uniref:Uncharacterized protein n=1 Tax=Arabidopsis arenosa TaxID=38785 RepID=A0A8S2AVN6_ARAAE|nr:unnamed protein product [Arabidopsis arenosa]